MLISWPAMQPTDSVGMAEIPSPIASSAAGAPLQARDLFGAGEARRAGQHHATQRQAQTITEAGATVETTDADARVFADTEGMGSQGRQLDEDHTDDEAQARKESGGITVDVDGQLHLDLEA